jgi:hypothetical protein
MEKVFASIHEHLYTIRLLFSGMYDSSKEKEGLTIDTSIDKVVLSSPKDDRNNLKSDRIKILKGYSISFKEKKAAVSSPELVDCK